MTKMVPMLGAEITERVFLPRFSELCSDKLFYVRRVCAAHFGEFCAVVGQEAFEKILVSNSSAGKKVFIFFFS